MLSKQWVRGTGSNHARSHSDSTGKKEIILEEFLGVCCDASGNMPTSTPLLVSLSPPGIPFLFPDAEYFIPNDWEGRHCYLLLRNPYCEFMSLE